MACGAGSREDKWGAGSSGRSGQGIGRRVQVRGQEAGGRRGAQRHGEDGHGVSRHGEEQVARRTSWGEAGDRPVDSHCLFTTTWPPAAICPAVAFGGQGDLRQPAKN